MTGENIKIQFIKRKNELLSITIISSLIMFFLVGNYSMIKIAINDFSQVSGNRILNGCFSLSYTKIFLLFIICAILVGYLFKNKQEEFNKITSKKINKKDYFIIKIISIIIPILISIAVNILLKTIGYFIFKDIFYGQFGITFSYILTMLIYLVLLTLVFSMTIFLFNIMVKDPWMAGIIPGFIFNSFILMFSIDLFFISEKISYIKAILSPIEIFVLNLLNLVYLNIRLENQVLWIQVMTFVFMLLLLLFIVGVSYILLGRITKKKLKKPYFFRVIRYLFYYSISFIIGIYSVSAIGYVIILNNPNINYDNGLLIVNIMSVIAVILLYIILNLIYKFNLNKSLKISKELSDSLDVSKDNISESKELIEVKEIITSKDYNYIEQKNEENIQLVVEDITVNEKEEKIEEVTLDNKSETIEEVILNNKDNNVEKINLDNKDKDIEEITLDNKSENIEEI